MKRAARTRAVAYLRVSTEKQADGGLSLDAQRSKVEAYAALYDIELVAVQVDAGWSAKSLERPALQAALRMLETGGADALLVVKLDRLTRSVKDLCELVDTHFRDGSVALLSVGEQVDTRSAAGRMVLNLLTAVGQWEREAAAERTKAAMDELKARGEFTGGAAPYGWSVGEGGVLERVPAEQDVIEKATCLRNVGMSLREVSSELARCGHFSRTGRMFAPSQVARMLSNQVFGAGGSNAATKS